MEEKKEEAKESDGKGEGEGKWKLGGVCSPLEPVVAVCLPSPYLAHSKHSTDPELSPRRPTSTWLIAVKLGSVEAPCDL